MADPQSVQECIRGSLMLVGAISQGEQPDNADAQDALARLINMIDSWSNDRMDIYTVQRYTFPLGTKQVYTAGPGGDWQFDVAPLKIENASCLITSTSPPSEIPVRIVNLDEWTKIPVKATTSPIPRSIYCDGQFPLANIAVYPVPTGANSIILGVWQQLLNFAVLTDDIILPKGYFLAIMFNLAILLAPFYGKQLGNDVAGQALMYKTRVERRNLPTHYLECDAAVQTRAQVFNWLTGEPT